MQEFVIPLHPEGLIKDPGDGRFCVQDRLELDSVDISRIIDGT
jgi:hypothetical protein